MVRTIGSMFPEAFRHLWKKRATVLYPFEKLELTYRYRGKLEFFDERCKGCKVCEEDCPSFAMEIKDEGKEQDGKTKFRRIYHTDRCLFCGQCAESCMSESIILTKEFELAESDKEKFTIESTYSTEIIAKEREVKEDG
ncbi:MAG: 4Fe-4S dicluster domain-containing protein [Methanophagales archaeon]|nr:4Fe-4S dicluster domain-containing protein [Methanophagales archaeon]